MRIHYVVLVLSLVVGADAAAVTPYEGAAGVQRMLSDCQVEHDSMDLGYCLGYLQGVSDGIWLCREDASLGQIQAVIVKYIKDHPEKWHEGGLDMAQKAVYESHLCRYAPELSELDPE